MGHFGDLTVRLLKNQMPRRMPLINKIKMFCGPLLSRLQSKYVIEEIWLFGHMTPRLISLLAVKMSIIGRDTSPREWVMRNELGLV